MRMIGIGLLGFLLAGVALLLSTMNILEQGRSLAQSILPKPELVFEHRMSIPVQSDKRATILRSNPAYPVILSGFPAYQSVAFSYPKDARPTSGYLQIDATSQVLAGAEGVLRISIQNTRRGEVLLRPGQARRSVQIPLSPSDFSGDQLVVSFSLQGGDDHQGCAPDEGIAASVEIETTSAVHLTLDRPLTSARDRFHAWGDIVRVAWPRWLTHEEQTRRLVLAAKAEQRGLRTQFRETGGEHALTTLALRDVLVDVSSGPVGDLNQPLHFARTGVNAGLRRFHRSAVWRTRYALQDGAGQRIPSHLDLQMVFGDLLGDQHWSLTVTLNNRLVVQESLAGPEAEYRTRVELPTEWQRADNQVEVVATSNSPRTGACDQGPELIAEMLPETRLVPGQDIYAGPVAILHEALAGIVPIRVALATSLTTLEADLATASLARVTSPETPLRPAESRAQIVIAGTDTRNLRRPETGSTWVVTQGAGDDSIDVRGLAAEDTLPSTGVFLLINPAGIELSGAPT